METVAKFRHPLGYISSNNHLPRVDLGCASLI